MKKAVVLRITTVPSSLHSLLCGQLKYMTDMGLDVYAVSSGGWEVDEIEKNEGVKHIEIPLTRFLSPIKDVIALYHMVKLFRKIKPDIVHTHTPKAGIVGMMAAFICSVPLKIHTVAGLPFVESRGLKKRLLIAVEQLTYRCADWVLPNSVEQGRFITNNIFDNKNKIVVIGKGSSNGINLDYFDRTPFVLTEASSFKRKYDITESNIVLSFVGRLANYKGINELVVAFKRLKTEHPQLKLLLVGPFEELNPLNEETLLEVKTNKDIICLGYQADIRPYLAASDIFVFPSYREGFPQSLMQASAMGLPCIASNINGCNEIIIENVTGVLVRPKDENDLVRKCEILITNEAKRICLAQQGRQFLKKHFEQKIIWKQIYEFYTSHLNE